MSVRDCSNMVRDTATKGKMKMGATKMGYSIFEKIIVVTEIGPKNRTLIVPLVISCVKPFAKRPPTNMTELSRAMPYTYVSRLNEISVPNGVEDQEIVSGSTPAGKTSTCPSSTPTFPELSLTARVTSYIPCSSAVNEAAWPGRVRTVSLCPTNPM